MGELKDSWLLKDLNPIANFIPEEYNGYINTPPWTYE